MPVLSASVWRSLACGGAVVTVTLHIASLWTPRHVLVTGCRGTSRPIGSTCDAAIAASAPCSPPPATLAPRLSAAGTPVSHHMRVLVEAGLVRSEKRGRWVFYALVPEAFQMLIDTLAPFALHGVGVSDRPSPAGCRCG